MSTQSKNKKISNSRNCHGAFYVPYSLWCIWPCSGGGGSICPQFFFSRIRGGRADFIASFDYCRCCVKDFSVLLQTLISGEDKKYDSDPRTEKWQKAIGF